MKAIYVILAVMLATSVGAADMIGLQGKLLNYSTNTEINGTFVFNVTFYNLSSGSPVYSEIANVTSTNGIWNYMVGKNTPINPGAFGSPTYSILKIGTETYAPVNTTYGPLAFYSTESNDSAYLGGQLPSYYTVQSDYVANNVSLKAYVNSQIVVSNASFNSTVDQRIVLLNSSKSFSDIAADGFIKLVNVTQAYIKSLGFWTSTDVDNSTIIRYNNFNQTFALVNRSIIDSGALKNGSDATIGNLNNFVYVQAGNMSDINASNKRCPSFGKCVIVVPPGVYQYDVAGLTIFLRSNTTYSGHGVLINKTYNAAVFQAETNIFTENVMIEGFDFYQYDDRRLTTSFIRAAASNTSNIEIKDNKFRNYNNTAIIVGGSSNYGYNWNVHNNLFDGVRGGTAYTGYDLSFRSNHLIATSIPGPSAEVEGLDYNGGQGGQVINNLIINMSEDGLDINAGHVIVALNRIYMKHDGATTEGIDITGSPYSTVHDNLIVLADETTDRAINIQSNSPYVSVDGNVIIGNATGKGLVIENETTKIGISNVFQNVGENINYTFDSYLLTSRIEGNVSLDYLTASGTICDSNGCIPNVVALNGTWSESDPSALKNGSDAILKSIGSGQSNITIFNGELTLAKNAVDENNASISGETSYILVDDGSKRMIALMVKNDGSEKARIQLTNNNTASGLIEFKTTNNIDNASTRWAILPNGTLQSLVLSSCNTVDITSEGYLVCGTDESGAGTYVDTWINGTIDSKILTNNNSVISYILAVNSSNPGGVSYVDTWINTTTNASILHKVGVANSSMKSYVESLNGTWDAADQTVRIAGENITTGTVADVRIASTIARDSEITSSIINANASLNATIDHRIYTNNLSLMSYILLVNASNPGGSGDPYSDLWINSTMTSLFVNRTKWTSIDNYPAACSAGTFMTAIGDTLTCSTPISANFALNTSVINVTTQFSGSVTGTYSTIQIASQSILIAGENVTTGTIADARIASTISRDSEAITLVNNANNSMIAYIATLNGTYDAADQTVRIDAANVTSGTLPVARGGTGVTTSTGTGSVVLNNSPVLTDPKSSRYCFNPACTSFINATHWVS